MKRQFAHLASPLSGSFGVSVMKKNECDQSVIFEWTANLIYGRYDEVLQCKSALNFLLQITFPPTHYKDYRHALHLRFEKSTFSQVLGNSSKQGYFESTLCGSNCCVGILLLKKIYLFLTLPQYYCAEWELNLPIIPPASFSYVLSSELFPIPPPIAD